MNTKNNIKIRRECQDIFPYVFIPDLCLFFISIKKETRKEHPERRRKIQGHNAKIINFSIKSWKSVFLLSKRTYVMFSALR